MFRRFKRNRLQKKPIDFEGQELFLHRINLTTSYWSGTGWEFEGNLHFRSKDRNMTFSKEIKGKSWDDLHIKLNEYLNQVSPEHVGVLQDDPKRKYPVES